MAGSHEVRGSIPLGSTINYAGQAVIVWPAFLCLGKCHKCEPPHEFSPYVLVSGAMRTGHGVQHDIRRSACGARRVAHAYGLRNGTEFFRGAAKARPSVKTSEFCW